MVLYSCILNNYRVNMTFMYRSWVYIPQGLLQTKVCKRVAKIHVMFASVWFFTERE